MFCTPHFTQYFNTLGLWVFSHINKTCFLTTVLAVSSSFGFDSAIESPWEPNSLMISWQQSSRGLHTTYSSKTLTTILIYQSFHFYSMENFLFIIFDIQIFCLQFFYHTILTFYNIQLSNVHRYVVIQQQEKEILIAKRRMIYRCCCTTAPKACALFT